MPTPATTKIATCHRPGPNVGHPWVYELVRDNTAHRGNRRGRFVLSEVHRIRGFVLAVSRHKTEDEALQFAASRGYSDVARDPEQRPVGMPDPRRAAARSEK